MERTTKKNISNSNNLNELLKGGVYKNCRLMHNLTSLIGCLVEVELASGERYEGIFKTFSPEFDLVLCSAAPVIHGDETDQRSTLGSNVSNLLACLQKNQTIIEMMVVKQSDMVKVKALNVDLDFATISKKTVLTDGEIAKMDGKKIQEKELIPWDDGGEADLSGSLDENTNGMSNGGWDSSEMFQYNERFYNINSTYKDDMTGYTIQLDKRVGDDDYNQKLATADQIAREIEKDPGRQKRLAKENDLDEETRFSAVVAKRNEPNIIPSNNMTRSPRNDMSHTSRDGRRESMRNNRVGDPSRDSRERDFPRPQGSRQGGRGGRDRDRGSDRGGDRDRVDRGGDRGDRDRVDRGGDRGDRDRGSSNRCTAMNEGNWRDNRRVERIDSSRFNSAPQPSFNNTTNNNGPHKNLKNLQKPPPQHQLPLQHQQQQQPIAKGKSIEENNLPTAAPTSANVKVPEPKNPKADQRPSQTPPSGTAAVAATPSSHEVAAFKSEPVVETKKELSPQSAVPPLASSVPIATVTPLSQTNAAAPANASIADNASTTSSTTSNNSKIKSNLNPNAKSFTPRANPSPASAPPQQQQHYIQHQQALVNYQYQLQHMVTGSPLVNPSAPTAPQQQPQFMQQSSQQQQAVVNYQYQSQHMATTPPSASMSNQFIQIGHPSHLPPHNIQHHQQPHHQQGHPQQGHPQQGHPQQAHPQQAHPQMARGGYMQFPPYNLAIPQMLPNGTQYITIPNVPTMPNAIPPHGVFPGPVPAGGPAQAAPSQPAGPNQSGPGAGPTQAFFATF